MLVASRLGRRSIGIDLAAEYLALARERAGGP
jgi:DNA modification methylase